ncbi:MAG: hypothetical protein IJT02_01165 [Synergistaceae bacterium]|nr:hypothetical protein [Synergistaceae bacterium]
MEAVLEREAAATKVDWRDIEMYYDDGRRITNPDILQSIAEGQELIAEWDRRIERTGMAEAMRRYYEGDDDVDGEEE